MKNTFWDKNKVFILGLLSAIAVALTPFTQNAEQSDVIKWGAVGYALITTILSYVARNLRGQAMSITGLIAMSAGVVSNLLSNGSSIKDGNFIPTLIIQLAVALIGVAVSDFKSRGYENTEVIKEAKREGEIIQPASLTNKAK